MLDYVAAMTLSPDTLARHELQTLARLLHTPFCAYPRALLHQWKTLGLPSRSSLSHRLQALRATTALRRRRLWAVWADKLHEKHGEVISLAAMGATLHIEPGWDSPAHALVLENEFRRCSTHSRGEVRNAFLEMCDSGEFLQSVMYRTLLVADHGGQVEAAITSRIAAIVPFLSQTTTLDPGLIARAVGKFFKEARWLCRWRSSFAVHVWLLGTALSSFFT